MRINQIWATLIGLASFSIGILRFFIPTLNENISLQDGIIHIVSGILFISGAWISSGIYVRRTNLWLGAFYLIFGATEINWPHMIAGAITLLIGLAIKTNNSDEE